MKVVQVIRDDGQPGTVVERLATAGEASQLVVPEERLIAQPDGTYHVRLNQTALVTQVATELVGDEPLVVPVVAEEVTIERVPLNTLVAGEAPTPYEEDGVLVIPILEEVLVVEKRLLHKENVRVTKRRIRISQPQQVTLRREVVEVERVAPGEQRAVPESELGDDRARRSPAVRGEESRQLGTGQRRYPLLLGEGARRELTTTSVSGAKRCGVAATPPGPASPAMAIT